MGRGNGSIAMVSQAHLMLGSLGREGHYTPSPLAGEGWDGREGRGGGETDLHPNICIRLLDVVPTQEKEHYANR
jgi:hypothetical protein